MSNRKELNCFVDDPYGNGVCKLHLVFEDGEYYGVWTPDDLDDSIFDYEEFKAQYGEVYYNTMKDYKNEISNEFDEWVESIQEED